MSIFTDPKYKWLWNIDTFIFLIIFIAVVWCFVTGKHKKPKHKVQFSDYSNIFDGNITSLKKVHRRRRRRLNKHEEKCRNIFQTIFRKPFKSVRPDFLKNPATGKNLELDGYCPDIVTNIGKGLAFEYDGVQHSKKTSHFHKGPHDFKYQCVKDEWKDKKCKELGIALVRIPHHIAYEDLETYIMDILKKKKLYISDVSFSNTKGLYD